MTKLEQACINSLVKHHASLEQRFNYVLPSMRIAYLNEVQSHLDGIRSVLDDNQKSKPKEFMRLYFKFTFAISAKISDIREEEIKNAENN